MSDEQSNQVERSACPTCGSCSGMFTANSMNCLTEALGLSQPGNGSLLATHADRKELFLNAGKRIVELTKRYYEQDDASALPRNIASKAAFENAMTLDIAMGGSTNTVLHLLAAAQEAEIDFTMSDIDKLSRKVPQLCKVAPSTQKYHMEDVHRAGGVLGILGELDRAGLLNRDVKNVLGLTLPQTLEQYDVMVTQDDAVKKMFRAGPAGIRTTRAFSQDCRWDTLDDDRAEGCIRSLEHAYSKDGGLAVLYGNFAENGCIVKTAGVDDSILKFTGPAKVYESQDEAVEAILGGKVVEGDVVVIRYEGPKGGPGMQGDALSDHLPEVHGSWQSVRADHRWPFLRRHLRAVHRPRIAGSGERRQHRDHRRWRHDCYRYSEPRYSAAAQRCRNRRPSRSAGSAWR